MRGIPPAQKLTLQTQTHDSLMWSELRNKFDPALLTVFMKVMSIAPVKVLTRRQQNVTLGV